LADASNASGGIALENGGVLGKGDQSRSVLRGLPVRVVRATIDVVNTFAIQFKGNTKFDQRLHLALVRDNAFCWGGDRPQVTGPDGRKAGAGWPL
jgi:hypothetical protein